MLNGFMIEYNGFLYSEANGFSETLIVTNVQDNGATEKVTTYTSCDGNVEVINHRTTYPALNIINKWVEVKNISSGDIKITRIDSVHGILPVCKRKLTYFTSAHGKEFTPEAAALVGTKILETTSGRSCRSTHPWFSLEGEDDSSLTCSVAWSGNWIMRFEPIEDDGYRISGGLNNWQFSKVLKPGDAMEGVHVIYLYQPCGDPDSIPVEFGRWGRKYWYPKKPDSMNMHVEWNHWYPYTDRYINEDVFKANVDKSRKLGMDVCTLDAGWFGPSEESTEWYFIRGDWHRVNQVRFPSGIKALADYTHSKGLKFGIWCEIEAAGQDAELSRLHPELVAKRDGWQLGYVCMGNPETVKWAFGVLENLIAGYGADWIKIDFNLDPAGCNRTDHGHGEGDGLYEHYKGLYRLVDMIREKYPQVLLENCSGGGMRLDLGLQKHFHLAFLSDPDYPVHAHQVFWGAAAMFHPSVCLHWVWSQTLAEQHNNGDNEPIKADMPEYKFDYIIRNALLKNPGFSYRLPELPQWCQKRLAYHIGFYKNKIKPFIEEADLYRLTGQTLRTGGGDRWNAYLYITEDKKDALMFIFKLPGGEKERVLRLKGLNQDVLYKLEFQDSGRSIEKAGASLMNEGIIFDALEEESSEIISLKVICTTV